MTWKTADGSTPPFNSALITLAPALALQESGASNCVRRRVGAVLLDPHGVAKAFGSNRVATSLPDCSYVCPRSGKSYEEVPGRTSYTAAGAECYSVHAEVNALRDLHGRILNGWWMVTTYEPCPDCADLLESLGITAIWREQ